MNAEEFHESRRRGRGSGEGRGKGTRDDGREEESESLQLRRRSYATDEKLVDVDQTTGEAKAGGGGGGEKGGRTNRSSDDSGERRDDDAGDGDGSGGSRSGDKGTRRADESSLGGRQGGACVGCGRCSCCEVALPFMKDAFDSSKEVAERTKNVNIEGVRSGEGRGRGGRRAPAGSGYETSESNDERRCRHSPDLRRDYGFGARRRDGGEGYGHDMAETGNRSDPSAGRGDDGFARRRRRRQQRQDDGREYDHHRRRPQPRQDGGRSDDRHRYRRGEEYFDGNRLPQEQNHWRTDRRRRYRRNEGGDGHQSYGVGEGDRHQRVAPVCSSGEVSSEEEHMSPRCRRARREAQAAAAANSARKESSRDTLRRKGDFARHRRREKHDGGGEGNAAFSTPVSTPRRTQPALAPSNQNFSTWRGGRRGRGTDNLDRSGGGDGSVLEYPALPPSALPEARRRRRHDLVDAAAAHGTEWQPDDLGGRRRADRSSREVWWYHSRCATAIGVFFQKQSCTACGIVPTVFSPTDQIASNS